MTPKIQEQPRSTNLVKTELNTSLRYNTSNLLDVLERCNEH